jgi:hypothetical protein
MTEHPTFFFARTGSSIPWETRGWEMVPDPRPAQRRRHHGYTLLRLAVETLLFLGFAYCAFQALA